MNEIVSLSCPQIIGYDYIDYMAKFWLLHLVCQFEYRYEILHYVTCSNCSYCEHFSAVQF